jgi:putative acetyltransferase
MALHCRVRPETPAEIDRITELTRLAFDGEHEVDMIADIRKSDRFVPELSLIAELGGELVGHCLLSRTSLASTTAPRVLQLGPICVDPSRQRRGIGGQLIIAAQDAARRRNLEPLIVLLGHPEYYPRFGFRPASDYGIRPDSPAAMAYPLTADVPDYRGSRIPT